MMSFTGADLDFKKDYPSFPEFKIYKIPLEYMDRAFIWHLQYTRDASGVPLYPSPDIEGWVRFKGDPDSRHFVDIKKEKLSDAGDLFPERGRIIEFFCKAIMMPFWGGIGLYADTRGPDGNPWPMIHLDTRGAIKRAFSIEKDKHLKDIWARFSDPIKGINKKYISLGESGFNDVLAEIIRMDRRSMA